MKYLDERQRPVWSQPQISVFPFSVSCFWPQNILACTKMPAWQHWFSQTRDQDEHFDICWQMTYRRLDHLENKATYSNSAAAPIVLLVHVSARIESSEEQHGCCCLFGFNVAFNIFLSYRAGVWLRQEPQFSLLWCCLTEASCPRHLTWNHIQSHFADTGSTSPSSTPRSS